MDQCIEISVLEDTVLRGHKREGIICASFPIMDLIGSGVSPIRLWTCQTIRRIQTTLYQHRNLIQQPVNEFDPGFRFVRFDLVLDVKRVAWVNSVEFSPDYKFLTSDSFDKSIHILICRLANRGTGGIFEVYWNSHGSKVWAGGRRIHAANGRARSPPSQLNLEAARLGGSWGIP
ncbi:hypothetical protein pipiens_014123 [Culex pipiens pipiens]|uniref:Uncharacterized protein n=1 Tax=Culex pipiens pipiens TaxID=38569 RepID=A0ABD1CVX7_CULPP